MELSDLIPGRFYWVIIALDVDAEEQWENEAMPARFVGIVDGKAHWNYLGQNGQTDWPVRWIGAEVLS